MFFDRYRLLKVSLIVVLLAALVPPTLSAKESDGAVAGALEPEERTRLVELLEDTWSQIETMTDGLDDAAWNFRASEDRWSIGQVVEHLMRAEENFYDLAQRALESPYDPEWESKFEKQVEWIAAVIPDRSKKAESPPTLRPDSAMSRDEVLANFEELRQRSLEFALTTEGPVKSHPLILEKSTFEPMSAYHWLIFMGYHNVRHLEQMAEIKAHADFPGK